MQTIRYNEEKRIKVLSERGVDLHTIAHMIHEGQTLDKIINPARDGQTLYIVVYQGYCCAVPCIENEKEIFIKTAYLSRKFKKLYS